MCSKHDKHSVDSLIFGCMDPRLRIYKCITDGYVPTASQVTVSVSEKSRKLQDTINMVSNPERFRISSLEKSDSRKQMMNVVDGVLDDPDNTKDDIEYFQKEMLELKRKLRLRRELFCEDSICGADDKEVTTKMVTENRHVDSKITPTIVWSAKTSAKGKKEKRKRNSLG